MTSRASLINRALRIGALAICSTACRNPEPAALTVAAAANLTEAFDRIAEAFTRQSGIRVVFSYGSTAQLAQQIENGAPFDVFAAADTTHVDSLVQEGKILPATRAIYARGRLALWIPPDSKAPLAKPEDLVAPSIRFVAIAKPEAAPYGAAAVEALQQLGIWDKVRPKVVYASNINMSKQFAATGNADAAFTAYSLVAGQPGRVILIDPKLHRPIDQALGILSASPRQGAARQFVSFVMGGAGRSILGQFGYQILATRSLNVR
jgi:molybdate transport system substrate-binding protein